MTVATHTGQLWALRKRVRVGDLVVLPLKTTSQIALGTVVRQYWYNKDAGPSWRHVVSVDWNAPTCPAQLSNRTFCTRSVQLSASARSHATTERGGCTSSC